MEKNETKYQQVKNFIIEYISKGNLKYNDKIYSEIELMERFGVSRHTVRRALSDLINEGWLYTQQGSGTFVSDPLANRKAQGKIIGVITTYYKDYIFPEIISGIDEVLSEQGYSILLGTTNNNIERERVVLSNMLDNNLAGVIIEPTKSAYPNYNIDLYQQLINRGIPFVYMHATYNNIPSLYVIEDDHYAGYIATSHLIELGHRNIIGIFKQDDMQGHGRYGGYIQALRENNINISDSKVIWYTTEEQKQFINNKLIKKIQKEQPEVTAFVCYNDQIAVFLMKQLSKLNIKVPDDYSVVSFDNSNIVSNLNVKLTTVAHPKNVLGEIVAKSLLEIMKDSKKVIKEQIKPELIIKNSTKANLKN